MSERAALHLVCRSIQNSRALDMCLQYCQRGDSLLFMQGGVASMPWANQAEFEIKKLKVYWLEADILARGLTSLASQEAWQIVNDDGFVELVERHTPIHTWA